ncbi:class I adenylate-forming enzyme family protein [Nitrospirillum iridis]|uniref:3-methylmercaptopropionyl-CoA ligase n=1 Tax=Nitrospirillum iridis TaxID=765888 RepID=A0A7X0EEQ5_9PROT|nr:AMP-binding protein [Nitrospirillum iridis]MBB6253275.1 long-chain acyl-CoA synthetase [Nitrospirillum iridis]
MTAQGTIAPLLARASARFGGRVALSFLGGASHTFDQTDELAGRVASGLAAKGVARGDRVLLHLPNSIEWVAVYHAIARLGAVIVPANAMATVVELRYMAQDAQVAGIVTSAANAAALRAEEAPFVVGCGADADGDGFLSLARAAYRPPAKVAPDDLFTICYTSGTTGRPKGVMLSHGNVFQSMAGTATFHVRHGGDVAFSALPFPHVYGNIVLNAVFLTGMRLIAAARFDAGEALRTISRDGVTLFEGVPTMYYQLLAHPDLTTANLTSLSRCTVGGQTMPLAKQQAVMARLGCPLLELWGMTELAGPATTHSPWWVPRPGTVGLPLPGVQVRIASLSAPSIDLPPGEDGEVFVRGPLTTRGYWKRPEATAEVLDRSGWLATGDIGHLDADGYLTVVDRKKDMILTAGYNVYPAELERVIALHPGVKMVAVVGVPDEDKGEVAHAFVVPMDDKAPDADELLAHCRLHLAAYKVPRRVSFVDDLPKTGTGKIMRGALRAPTA